MIRKSFSDDYHVMTSLSTWKELTEALNWCKQNIQPYDPEGCNLDDTRGYAFERFHNSTNFVFMREKDAFIFALRWL